MINDPFHPEEAIAQERDFTRRKLLAIVCAVAVTALLLAGYGFIRRRHAQQTLANTVVPITANNNLKTLPLAHIIIDEPMLNKGVTTIGGIVKNISERELTGLSIALELRKRTDGTTEQTLVRVQPQRLGPQEEGAYSIQLSAQSYGSIRFIGLKGDPELTQIAYSTSPGKKRPPERLEPQVISGKRSSRKGEFLNSPDNPVRIP